MGVVYLAENTLMGRKEVLKVVSSHLINRRGVLDRFLGEIRNAARLHHPNVVTAYSVLRLGESLVLAMEYVEGLDLARLVKASGPLPVAHACNYLHQAALGLQHAHENGMVHRDIKPGNLMLSSQGSRALVKVLDFGLAKVIREGPTDGTLTHEGQMLGTPDYIAPEQIVDARRADIRADIYSLGCTLYYLLTGGPPFQATSLYDIFQAHHSMDAMPLNLVRPEVPVELAALVGKMMAKEPERRFQEPREVAQALKPFFKAGNVAVGGSKPEVSQAERSEAKQATPGAVPTPIESAANQAPAASPAVRKPPEPTRPGAILEGLIDLQDKDPLFDTTLDRPTPTPAMESGGRPPWKSIPLVAPASLFGLVMLGVIIILITRNSRTTIDTDKGKTIITIETPPPEAHDGPETNRNTPSDITIDRGNWTIEGDELVQSEEYGDATLAFGEPDWSDYDVTLEAQKVSGRGNGVRVVFHRLSSETYCQYTLGDGDNIGGSLSFVHKGQYSRTGDANKDNWAWGGINLGQWYPVKIKVRKSHFECYLKNDLMFEESHSSFSRGRIGLRTSGIQARFRHIKVTDPRGKVLFEGLPGGPGVTTEIQVSHKDIKPSTPTVQKIGTLSLFNGKDRDGWIDKIQNGSKWAVSNGVLVGRGAARASRLC